MEKPASTGIRKRQQISQANRVMFLWIAGVSVVVGVSLVLVIFLVQKIWFGEKVISEKNHTASVLEKNIATAQQLKDNIQVLNTNDALNSIKLNDSDSAVQSVLDALPATANPTALASSLQTKLLAGVQGVVVETINVDTAAATTSSTPTASKATTAAASAQSTAGSMSFTFSVSTDANNYDALRQVLERLEKSIRPFDVKTLSVDSQGTRIVMNVTGVSYYQPAQTLDLKTKVVKP